MRGVVWCGGGGERVWWIYIIYIYIYIIQVRYFPVIYSFCIIAIQTTMDRLMILVVILPERPKATSVRGLKLLVW